MITAAIKAQLRTLDSLIAHYTRTNSGPADRRIHVSMTHDEVRQFASWDATQRSFTYHGFELVPKSSTPR